MSTATAPPDPAQTTGSTEASSTALDVTVVFALPHTIWRRNISVAAGSTVADALEISGFLSAFPEFAEHPVKTGIYGRACGHDQLLRMHDRVEIYRELVFDPMESRRRRARHKQRKAQEKAARRG